MVVQINILSKKNKNPCGSTSFPFKSDKCNIIWAGATDADVYLRHADDNWDFNWLGITGPNSYETLAQQENAGDGDVLFQDKSNGQVLFKLPWYFVNRERVTKVLRLCYRLKYSTKDGKAGYVLEDPDPNAPPSPNDPFINALLVKDMFRSQFSLNPINSPLETIFNWLDGLLDDMLPDLANLVPWYVYAGAAAYTGFKTKEALPAKPRFKDINLKSGGYGAATGYLAHRAVKSYQAKKAREKK